MEEFKVGDKVTITSNTVYLIKELYKDHYIPETIDSKHLMFSCVNDSRKYKEEPEYLYEYIALDVDGDYRIFDFLRTVGKIKEFNPKGNYKLLRKFHPGTLEEIK